MSLELSSIKRDLSTEDEGQWVEIPEWPGIRLKVRSIQSRDYQIQRGLLEQKLQKALGRQPTAPEWEPGLGKLIARYLLRGWEGFLLDGKPLEYTAEIALAMFADRQWSGLEMQVVWASTRVGDRDAEFTQDAIKNSAVPSATS